MLRSYHRTARQAVVVALLIALALALMASMALYRQSARARARAEANALRATWSYAVPGAPVDSTPGDGAADRQTLADASTRVREYMNDKPEVAAALRLTIGRSYVQLGEYARAEYELLAAHELCAGADGRDATCAAVVSQLVQLYEAWHAAEPQADHAAAAGRWRARLAPTPPDEGDG